MKFVIMGSLVLALTACSRPTTTPVGKVQDCDNGTYFSLKTQTCQTLWGHEAMADSEGFERIHIYNGVTVPRKINGHSPFLVTVAYDVNRPTTLEVVLKRALYGSVGGDGLSDWHKIEIPPGSGTRDVIVTPSYALPDGPAAAYIDGRWAIDSGYMLEIKGGDRFEDEDTDRLGSWRVAGIQVDSLAPRDPAAVKTLILGDLEAPDQIVGCEKVTVKLPVERLSFNAKFDLALKKPVNNWDNNGDSILWVQKGFQGTLEFQFEARNKETGACAIAGRAAIKDDTGNYPPDSYLFQLDIYKDGSEKLNTQSELFTVPEGSQPVIVASSN